MTLCAGCQVKEASRLECPNCKKYVFARARMLTWRLGINGSFFCDQDCFKKSCELAWLRNAD